MSDTEMKPCPFCGGTAFDHTEDCYFKAIIAAACGDGEGVDDDDFDRIWNTRHITLEQAKKVVEEGGGLVVEPGDALFSAVRGRNIIKQEAKGDV